jgi:hypothetical protein
MGLDQILSDPTKLGIVGLLVIAIASFFRGWIIPVVTHDKIVSGLNLQLVEKDARIKKLEEERNELMHLAMDVTQIMKDTQKVRAGVFKGNKG